MYTYVNIYMKIYSKAGETATTAADIRVSVCVCGFCDLVRFSYPCEYVSVFIVRMHDRSQTHTHN